MDTERLFGYPGNYRPRFGLWLNNSERCRHAVLGLLSEGWDCDVIFKYGSRCQRHAAEPFRRRVMLSYYLDCAVNSPEQLTGELTECDPFEWMIEDERGNATAIMRPGCCVREVFFADPLNLRRRRLDPIAAPKGGLRT